MPCTSSFSVPGNDPGMKAFTHSHNKTRQTSREEGGKNPRNKHKTYKKAFFFLKHAHAHSRTNSQREYERPSTRQSIHQPNTRTNQPICEKKKNAREEQEEKLQVR
mmetsp:Transcript_39752/g.78299  ORF Transcript_39752/g.78299 Transcript_39752/m.78299 type:complete len:106 (-) Transcript_39752:684-1001(-)